MHINHFLAKRKKKKSDDIFFWNSGISGLSRSLFLAFSGVFESDWVSLCVCVLGVILPIMQCAEALRGIG